MGTTDTKARRARERIDGSATPRRRVAARRGPLTGRGRGRPRGRPRDRVVPPGRAPGEANLGPSRVRVFADQATMDAGPEWAGLPDDGDRGLDAGFDEIGDLAGLLDGLAARMRREGALAAHWGDDPGED